MSHTDDILDAWLDGATFFGGVPQQATPNTFLRCPEPRAGFLDARRDDGCIPCITVLEH